MATGKDLVSLFRSNLGKNGSQVWSWYNQAGTGWAWCQASVCWGFYKIGAKELFYNGQKTWNCSQGMNWCKANLAQVPIELAAAGDIIYFDWNNNKVPDHVGLIEKKSTHSTAYCIEGNTNGGKFATRTRESRYVMAVYRPKFPMAIKPSTYKLTVDGEFGQKSIYSLQKALGIQEDGILTKDTVRALQRLVGASADGHWGVATSKKVQKALGVVADGDFGKKSQTALQEWINDKVCPQQVAPNGRTLISALKADTELELMTSMVGQSLAIADSNHRVVFYSKRDGSLQKMKMYNRDDLEGTVASYASLGHCNGSTYNGTDYYVCSYYNGKNTKLVTVVDGKKLKIKKTITLPVAVTAIGCDRKTGIFYGTRGTKIYRFGENFKTYKTYDMRFTDGLNQDIFANDGTVYVCRSYVKGNISCIDAYSNGKYKGSYTVPANELESADIDEEGFIHYITWNKARLIKTNERV